MLPAPLLGTVAGRTSFGVTALRCAPPTEWRSCVAACHEGRPFVANRSGRARGVPDPSRWARLVVLLVIGGGGVVGTGAAPLRAQLVLGAHASRAQAVFGGADGVGARVGVEFAALSVVAVGDWYPVDCPAAHAGGCGYRSGAVRISVEMPTPILHPYLFAGLGLREIEPMPVRRMAVVGFGLRLEPGFVGLFAEVAGELPTGERLAGETSPDGQLVMRVGVRF